MNLKDFFNRLLGRNVKHPAAHDAGWNDDSVIRRFALDEAVQKRELMARDFLEFITGMDAYNQGRPASQQIVMEVHRDMEKKLERFISGEEAPSPYGGLIFADGVRLRLGAQRLRTEYYNDMVYNTGLRVLDLDGGLRGEFLFGLPQPQSFEAFARTLAPRPSSRFSFRPG